MKKKPDHIDLLIARNLSGEASKAEGEQLETWLSESASNYAEYKIIQETSKHSYPETKLLITEDSFQHVMKQWDEGKENEIKHNRYPFMKILLVSAASIALILVSVFTYRQILYLPGSVADLHQPVLIEKASPIGQKTKLFLPDGTSVWLNGGSHLQYTSDYGDSLRSVSLTGEAYFEVKENRKNPFQIKTGNVVITTLKSSFNVNTFYKDGSIEVVMDDGAVLLENMFSSFVPGMPKRTLLKQGERATYSLRFAAFEIIEVKDTYDYTCWRDGIISFQQTDFITLINTLERWYGVKFTWDEMPKANWTFSGEFNNVYLDRVLQALSQDEKFSFEKDNSEVKLIFKNSDLKLQQ